MCNIRVYISGYGAGGQVVYSGEGGLRTEGSTKHTKLQSMQRVGNTSSLTKVIEEHLTIVLH